MKSEAERSGEGVSSLVAGEKWGGSLIISSWNIPKAESWILITQDELCEVPGGNGHCYICRETVDGMLKKVGEGAGTEGQVAAGDGRSAASLGQLGHSHSRCGS